MPRADGSAVGPLARYLQRPFGRVYGLPGEGDAALEALFVRVLVEERRERAVHDELREGLALIASFYPELARTEVRRRVASAIEQFMLVRKLATED
jgi:hypothetical protein